MCILQVTVATVGLEDWGQMLPVAVEDGAVIAFLQGTCLFVGTALSLLLTRKIGARPWLWLAPQCATILAFAGELWAVILP
jgi:hypothetical protein